MQRRSLKSQIDSDEPDHSWQPMHLGLLLFGGGFCIILLLCRFVVGGLGEKSGFIDDSFCIRLGLWVRRNENRGMLGGCTSSVRVAGGAAPGLGRGISGLLARKLS